RPFAAAPSRRPCRLRPAAAARPGPKSAATVARRIAQLPNARRATCPRPTLTERGTGAHRGVGLALRAVARRLLPEGPAAARRAPLRGEPPDDGRDQRLVLFAAAARSVRALAR